MWVKICGNTRLEDCLAAAELGADAVGFVFVPGGRRTVTAAQVAAITVELPVSVEKIGVFSTFDYDEISATVEKAGLTGVQLHTGGLDVGLLRRMRAYFGPTNRPSVIQVLHRWIGVSEAEQGEAFASAVKSVVDEGSADALLIDSKSAAGSGGTGRTFDWAAAAAYLREVTLPVIVAGGLKPENVAEAVRVLRPAGVDVSGGVEAGTPGVKDRDAVARFIANARAAGEFV